MLIVSKSGWTVEVRGNRVRGMGDLRQLVWVVVLFLMTLAGPVGNVRAQTIQYEFGPAPGEAFEWPGATDLFTGSEVVLSPPTVVIVRSLSPCEMCEVPVAMARSWLERFDNVQTILVTRDDDDTTSLRTELIELAGGLTVVVDDGRISDTLGFNSQPIIYVVSEEGVVRFRQTGFNPQRLLALDTIVALANDQAWDQIDEFVGRDPDDSDDLPDAWGVDAGGGPVIAIVHSDDCTHCQRMVEQGMVTILNDYAGRHPEATFVVLEEANALDFDRHLEQLVEIYGERIRRVFEEALRSAPVAAGTGRALAGAAFERNIRVIEYVPGGRGDPMNHFGAGVVPNILWFDQSGSYLGPEPYWLGPYDAGGLIDFLQAAFGD